MKKKIAIWSIILFVLIVVIFAAYMAFMFIKSKANKELKEPGVEDICKKKANTFYQMPKDSIDVMFIGSSAIERYWVPPVAWNEHGLASYSFSTGSQPAIFTKYIIAEVQQHQNPKLYVIEVRRMIGGPETIRTIDSRRVASNFKSPLNGIAAKIAVLDYVNRGENPPDISTLPDYINSKDDQPEEELRFKQNYFGFYEFKTLYRAKQHSKPKLTTKEKKISDLAELVVEDLLDYCDTLDADVLFVASPYVIDTKEQKQINYVLGIMQKRGYKTINFNTEEIYTALNLDFSRDLYNPRHVNMRGAIKFTSYLGSHLNNTYTLQDHRSSMAYAQWEKRKAVYFKRLQKKAPQWNEEYLRRQT